MNIEWKFSRFGGTNYVPLINSIAIIFPDCRHTALLLILWYHCKKENEGEPAHSVSVAKSEEITGEPQKKMFHKFLKEKTRTL
jgi:hypothetical protein